MELNVVQIKRDLKRIRKQKDRKVEFRLVVLAEYETAKWKKRYLVSHGVSERTYYRWKQRYLEDGLEGLKDKKGRGRKKKNDIRGKLASKIKYYRTQYGWGAEVICVHLQASGYKKLSQYKVNRFLKDKKFIKVKKRKPKNKHTKVVKVSEPGKHTQVDVKHLTELHPSKKAYAYNFVDHASKWSYKKIYDSYGPSETRCFMEEVIRKAPFTILSVQTDNGIEFTNKFVSDPIAPKLHALDKLCEQNKTKHRLIPVGEKELNGLVEKHHHIDWKEFYRRQKGYDLELINKRLQKHCEWRNSYRRFKSINWKTPNEYIQHYEKTNLNQKIIHLTIEKAA